MSPLKCFIKKRHYYIAVGIVIAALVVKYFYIFHCTSYRDSLVHDMGDYWYGAFKRGWGDQTSFWQWGGFPPFYKFYFLAPFFKFLNNLGALSYALTLVISINILFYGISSCIFYLIVDRLMVSKITALSALIFYSFSYLATYLNALVLPEDFALPLTVASIGVLILTVNWAWVFIAGLLFGIAIATKPILFIYGMVSTGFVFSKHGKKNRVWMLMIFTAAMALVPLMTIAENNRVSDGKLRSLASIGGVNFFQGWAKVGEVSADSKEGDCHFYSPGAVDQPTWKEMKLQEPWYHQGYYYHLGLESIRKDPRVLLEKISWFRKFFWGGLGPCLKSPPLGYDRIMPAVQNISYMMFISLGMFCLFIRRHSRQEAVWFLSFLMAAFFIAIYAIGMPERRYYFDIEFLVIALFFVMVDRMIVLYRAYRREVWIYALLVFVFFICIPATWQLLNSSLL